MRIEPCKLPAIVRLCEQLLRGPRRLRLRQLAGIDFVLSVIEQGRSYPFDFVCHALTNFRPTGKDAGELLAADDLLADLAQLAEILSADADLSAAAVREPLFGVQELAHRLDVSTKTIFRWRRRGLPGWRIRGADRRQRLMFHESAIRRFVAHNLELVRRGGSFSQLTQAEREAIVARAAELVDAGHRTVNAVARVIASERGRAVETVRLLLKQHDESDSAGGLFNRGASLRRDDQQLAMWEAYNEGASLASLAQRFECSESVAYAAVLAMRAAQRAAEPIPYVDSDEFAAEDAVSLILHTPPAGPLRQALTSSAARTPTGLPSYLAQLFRTPLLTPAGERHLFRKMNFLRHQAETLRRAIDPQSPDGVLLDRIDDLLRDAGDVKNEIVQANLRLVVGIAKRHLNSGHDLFELISDGNVSLMRAVDKFDYSRGFKFSTYATWAIVKNFARSLPEQKVRRDRYQTGWDEMLVAVVADGAEERDRDDCSTVRGAVDRMLGSLDDREQQILRQRYGLDEPGQTQTLEQIGQRLGVSKERVRQIETRALAKLRGEFTADALGMVGE